MRLISSPDIHIPSLLEACQNGHITPNAYVSGSITVVPMDGKAKARLGYTGSYGGVQRFLAQRFKNGCLFTFTRPLIPYKPVWREDLTNAIEELTSASQP